jgi:hypothetical protein
VKNPVEIYPTIPISKVCLMKQKNCFNRKIDLLSNNRISFAVNFLSFAVTRKENRYFSRFSLSVHAPKFLSTSGGV